VFVGAHECVCVCVRESERQKNSDSARVFAARGCDRVLQGVLWLTTHVCYRVLYG